jgi:hypothetical protein
LENTSYGRTGGSIANEEVGGAINTGIRILSVKIVIVIVILIPRKIQLGNGRKPAILPQIHSHLAITTSSNFYTLCLKSVVLKLSTACARAS